MLGSFLKEKELKVVLLLDFISDQETRQLKGKQKAASGKAADQTPKSSLPTSSLDTNTNKSPSKKTLLKKKNDGFVPIDTLISDIEEARKNVDKNIWDLPMSDFSRDQIMAYIQGFFGTKWSEIMHSINAHESTFTQMVSTAVRYWDDKQLIEPLIDIVIVIVIALCLQYVLKGYPRKFLELLAGTPPHLTLNQVSYHSAESTEEIA